MPGLEDIRAGLAAALDDIPRLQNPAYVLASPTLPVAQIAPVEIDYDKAFQRGFDVWNMRITVLAGAPSDIGAQKDLDRFCDPSGVSSVKAAVEADRTLGGAVSDLRVRSCSGWQLIARAGESPALGATWEVEVWADPSE